MTVSGSATPTVGRLEPIVDVSPVLEAGTNEIGVEVATTLNNRMRTAGSDICEITPRREDGPLGPVELNPYEDRRLRTSAGADE